MQPVLLLLLLLPLSWAAPLPEDTVGVSSPGSSGMQNPPAVTHGRFLDPPNHDIDIDININPPTNSHYQQQPLSIPPAPKPLTPSPPAPPAKPSESPSPWPWPWRTWNPSDPIPAQDPDKEPASTFRPLLDDTGESRSRTREDGYGHEHGRFLSLESEPLPVTQHQDQDRDQEPPMQETERPSLENPSLRHLRFPLRLSAPATGDSPVRALHSLLQAYAGRIAVVGLLVLVPVSVGVVWVGEMVVRVWGSQDGRGCVGFEWKGEDGSLT